MSAPISKIEMRLVAAGWLLLVVSYVVYLWPSIGRSHVEGFSYFTDTMSMLLPDYGSGDWLWQFNAEFFYLSRPAVTWLIKPFSSLFPGSGYFALMTIATPLYLLGLALMIHRWSGSGAMASLAAMLATPIVFEANYFTNDTIVAAAFAVWAMYLSMQRTSLLFHFAGGALMSLAILCRLDQIFLVPLFLVIFLFDCDSLALYLRRAVAFVVGLVSVHVLAALVDPNAANILLRIDAANHAVTLWERNNRPIFKQMKGDRGTALIAFGAALPALAVGAAIVIHRAYRSWRAASKIIDALNAWLPTVALIGCPIALYIVACGKFFDARGYLTMVPLLAVLSAIAIRHATVMTFLGEASSRIKGALLFAAIFIPVFVPTPAPRWKEAETPQIGLTGRMWQTSAWSYWKQSRERPFEAAAKIIDVASESEAPSAIVSSDWTDDRAAQNALAASGFRPIRTEIATCNGASEAWARNGKVILHVRAHVPFLPQIQLNSAVLYVARIRSCLLAIDARHRFALSPNAIGISPTDKTQLVPSSDGLLRITDQEISIFDGEADQIIANYVKASIGSAESCQRREYAERVLADIHRKLRSRVASAQPGSEDLQSDHCRSHAG